MTKETKSEVMPRGDPANPHVVMNFGFYADVDLTSQTELSNFYRNGHIEDPIVIEVATNGGDPEVMLNIQDFLKTRRTPKLVVVIGRCCSAGMGLLALPGSTRLAFATSQFMQHGPLLHTQKKGSFESVQSSISLSKDLQDIFQLRIKNSGGLSDEEVEMLFSGEDLWFDSIDALMMGSRGLIDGIVLREVEKYSFLVITREGIKKFRFPTDDVSKNPVLTEEELNEYGMSQYVPDSVVKAFARRKARTPK